MTDNVENAQTISKEELKQQALLERIAQLTAEYENKIVDLRVEYTYAVQQIEQLTKALEEADPGAVSQDYGDPSTSE